MRPIPISLLVLSISLCSASLLDNYETCTKDEVNEDQVIQDVLNYGCDQLYDTAYQDKKVKSFSYKRTDSATQAYKQSYDAGTSYTCSVSLYNSQGETVNGAFTVYYDSKTGSKSFLDCSYNVQCKDQATSNIDKGTYTQVSSYDVQSSNKIQGCIVYGVKQVLTKAMQKGKITGSGYTITKFVSVSKKVQSSGTYYKCRVNVSNAKDCLMTIDMNVYYKNSNKQKSLKSYSYTIDKIPKPKKQSTGDYEEIKDYSENDVRDCLNYGIQQTVENYQDYPNTQVNGVWKYDTQNGQGDCYYKYEVELSNEQKTKTAACSFTLWYNSYTQEKQVQTYSYKARSSSSSSSIGSWGPSSSSGSSIESGKYSKISSSSVYSNSKYQDVTNYGVQKCLESLYDNGVISNTNDYSVSDVANCLVKKDGNNENYKIRVNLKNDYGVSLETNFEVQYDTSNAGKTLTGYSVQGSCPVKVGDVLIVDYTNINPNGGYDNNNNNKNNYNNNGDDTPSIYDTTNPYASNNDNNNDNNNNYNEVPSIYDTTNPYANSNDDNNNANDSYEDNQVDVGIYHKINDNAYSVDSEARDCVNYGVEETVKQVVKKENITTKDYQVKQIRNVCQDNDNAENYRVDAVLVNSKGSTLDCSFSVKKDAKSGKKSLVSYSYATY